LIKGNVPLEAGAEAAANFTTNAKLISIIGGTGF
jgi:hypothetical protein